MNIFQLFKSSTPSTEVGCATIYGHVLERINQYLRQTGYRALIGKPEFVGSTTYKGDFKSTITINDLIEGDWDAIYIMPPQCILKGITKDTINKWTTLQEYSPAYIQRQFPTDLEKEMESIQRRHTQIMSTHHATH